MRELWIAVLLLGTVPVSPEVRAGNALYSVGHNLANAPLMIDVAVREAPIGHRQPTPADLPPWLRELEDPAGVKRSNPGAAGDQGRQKQKGLRPDDSGRAPGGLRHQEVPQICRC
jgi:hypothetical protein